MLMFRFILNTRESEIRKVVSSALIESSSEFFKADAVKLLSLPVDDKQYVGAPFTVNETGEKIESEILWVRSENNYYVTSWPSESPTILSKTPEPTRESPVPLSTKYFNVADSFIRQLKTMISSKLKASVIHPASVAYPLPQNGLPYQ